MGLHPNYQVFIGYPLNSFPKLKEAIEESDYGELYEKLFEEEVLIDPYDEDTDNMYIGVSVIYLDWDSGIAEYEKATPSKTHIEQLIKLGRKLPKELRVEFYEVVTDVNPKLYHYCNLYY